MQLSSLEQVDRNYRHVYIQPHYDDAVLSAGGSVALQAETGQRCLVVTVFGGVPPAGAPISGYAAQTQQRMALGLDAAEAVLQRRVEDAAALSSLGADVLWLDYLDAIYRGSPPSYQSDEALFGTVSAGDLALDEQLAALLLKLHQQAPLAAFYAPLGVGHHVDHQLCCSAADRLAQRKLNVKFYEDFPYVSGAGALEARQRELSIEMEPEFVEISGTVARKEEAVALYRSQLGLLFGTQERAVATIEGYSASIRRTYPGIMIERFWRW